MMGGYENSILGTRKATEITQDRKTKKKERRRVMATDS